MEILRIGRAFLLASRRTIVLAWAVLILVAAQASAQPAALPPAQVQDTTAILGKADEFYREGAAVAADYFEDTERAQALATAIENAIGELRGEGAEFGLLWENLQKLRVVITSKATDSTLSVFARDSLQSVWGAQAQRIDSNPTLLRLYRWLLGRLNSALEFALPVPPPAHPIRVRRRTLPAPDSTLHRSSAAPQQEPSGRTLWVLSFPVAPG